jgi:ligand-binding sensor domain-containing protein
MLALAAAPDGTLWIGTAGGGLVAHDRAGFATRTTAHGMPSDRVQALAGDARGVAWAGTDRGLARVTPDGTIRVFGRADGLPHDEIVSVFAVPGAVHVGTRAGMARIEGDDVRVFAAGEGAPAGDVRSIAAAGDGGLWVGVNGGGVVHFDGHTFRALDARLTMAQVLARRRGFAWRRLDRYERWRAAPLEGRPARDAEQRERATARTSSGPCTSTRPVACGPARTAAACST